MPLLLSVLGIVMMAESMLFRRSSTSSGISWFALEAADRFALFFVAAMAEANRTPFDMPEAASELVAGYKTEYSGMKFVSLCSPSIRAFCIGLLISLLFLGGWHMPFLPSSFVWLLLKAYLFVFMALWLRGTLPRIRSTS